MDTSVTMARQYDTEIDWRRDGLALVGRFLLAVIFVMSGWSKLSGFSGTVGYIAHTGLPMPEVLAAIAVLFELGGGLMIVLGWKARWAGRARAVCRIVKTPNYFWAAAPDAFRGQLINFQKNVSILGGMLVLAAFGPGRYSFDRG